SLLGPRPNGFGSCWPRPPCRSDPPCWSKKRRRKSSNGAPPRKSSGIWAEVCSEPGFSVTEMLTTAGKTFLTNGAKLCCGTAKVCAALAELSAGGVWAQTSGDTASVAPSPNPRTATRAFFNQGWRKTSAGCCIIKDLPLRCCDQSARPQP